MKKANIRDEHLRELQERMRGLAPMHRAMLRVERLFERSKKARERGDFERAIELEYQQLHAVLSEKGDNLEEVETQILELWARWQGKHFDGSIDYPDDFSVRDLDRDLERAIKAVAIEISSPTFKSELSKKVVSSALPKLSDDVRAKIDKEIEAGG